MVYVQQSISALIALSHVKKGAKYLGGPPLAFFFSNFRLKKNCSKDTLKMLHLCKCHETNVVDLWPLEGRDGWVCPVNLTDRERSEDGQAASLVLPLGGPSSLFCGLISYFFPQKNNLSFPAEPEKKLTSSLDPKVVSAEHQFASWLEKIIFWFIFKKKALILKHRASQRK